MLNTQEITGQWNQLRGKVKEKWGQLTDDDLRIVGGNVDQLIGRIQQKTGETRSAVEDFLSDLTESAGSTIGRASEAAREYAQGAAESLREGYEQVSDQAQQGLENARELVRSRPAQSMGAVFAAGVLTGVCLGLLLHSDRH